jgi:cell division septation protein DedD
VLGSGPSLEIAGLTLGLREALIGLIVLVALYMVFELLRMRYLRNKAQLEALTPAVKEKPEPQVSVTDEDADDLPAPRRPEPDWERPPVNLAQGILRQGMEQELTQMREEVDALRGELAALRAEMQQEVTMMRASQTVSPIYSDAMQMAISGHDAGLIAERCGIARAEAELVVSLAKSQNN